MTEIKKTKKDNFWIYFFIFCVIPILIRSFFIDWYRVPSYSMMPTIDKGNYIFINKNAYSLRIPLTNINLLRWGVPERGDIVVFSDPENKNSFLVKRVIGLPGDIINIKDSKVSINGKESQYIDSTAKQMVPGQKQIAFLETLPTGQKEVILKTLTQIEYPKGMNNGRNAGSFKVENDKIFLMGDNRDNSFDSRYIGNIDINSVVGKVIKIY